MSATATLPIMAPSQIKRCDQALAFMRENFAAGIGMREIAAHVGYSPFHFHHVFRVRFGKTFKRMLLEMQVEQAMRLMLDGVPLVLVAEEAGFCQQSHFTERFRQVVGMTPRRWLVRERRRKSR